jgi:hypothetical protein
MRGVADDQALNLVSGEAADESDAARNQPGDVARPSPAFQAPAVEDDHQTRSPGNISLLKIFYWNKEDSSIALPRLADALHDTLSEQFQKKERSAYDACGEATFVTLQDAIARAQRGMSTPQKKHPRSRQVAIMEEITALAQYLIAFFWPIDYDHITTRKFYGAVRKLLERKSYPHRVCWSCGVLTEIILTNFRIIMPTPSGVS